MPRPPALSWEVAGSLYTAGTTAWTAVEGLGLSAERHRRRDRRGRRASDASRRSSRACAAPPWSARSVETRFDFLRQFGVLPTAYGPGTRRAGARPRARPGHRVPRLPRRRDGRGARPRRAGVACAHHARLERGRRAPRRAGLRRRRRRARHAWPRSRRRAASACRSPTCSRSTPSPTPTARSTSARRPARSCSGCASSSYAGQRVHEPAHQGAGRHARRPDTAPAHGRGGGGARPRSATAACVAGIARSASERARRRSPAAV